jgi:hypothetical protein
MVRKTRVSKAPKLISRAKLTSLVAYLAKRRVTIASTPVMALTPRHPYDAVGNMDFFGATVWDTGTPPTGLILLPPTTPPDTSIFGEGRFQAPAPTGPRTTITYAIVANFVGLSTMKLSGPWGDSIATGPGASAAVVALWTPNRLVRGGNVVVFRLACTQSRGLATFLGFQAFALS